MKRLHFAAVFLLALPAAAQGKWVYETVLSEADQSTYTGFVSPTMNATGAIAFIGKRAGAPGHVVGLDEGATRTLYDPASPQWGTPVPNGLVIADNGDVGIPTNDAFLERRVIVWDESAGILREVANLGIVQALLGPGARVFDWDMNEAGQFVIMVFDGGQNHWLLRWTDGAFDVVAHADESGPGPWKRFLSPVIDDDGSIYANVHPDAGGSELVLFPPAAPPLVLNTLPGETLWELKNVKGGELIYYGVELPRAYLRRRSSTGVVSTLAAFGCGEDYVAVPSSSQVTVSMNSAGDFAFYAAIGDCDASAIGIFNGPTWYQSTVHLDGACVSRGRTDPYTILFSRDAMDAQGNILLRLSSRDYSASGSVEADKLVLALPEGAPGGVMCDGSFPAHCPCLNESSGCARGCANSLDPGNARGAFLEGVGSSRVSSDDLRLRAGDLIPGEVAVLFAGAPLAGSQVRPFGRGRLCAGAPHRRLGLAVSTPFGVAQWGPGLMSLGGFDAGLTRTFQVWYRDPNAGSCGRGFNLSNGYEVTLLP